MFTQLKHDRRVPQPNAWVEPISMTPRQPRGQNLHETLTALHVSSVRRSAANSYLGRTALPVTPILPLLSRPRRLRERCSELAPATAQSIFRRLPLLLALQVFTSAEPHHPQLRCKNPPWRSAHCPPPAHPQDSPRGRGLSASGRRSPFRVLAWGASGENQLNPRRNFPPLAPQARFPMPRS